MQCTAQAAGMREKLLPRDVPRPLYGEHQSIALGAHFDRFPAERAHVESVRLLRSALAHRSIMAHPMTEVVAIVFAIMDQARLPRRFRCSDATRPALRVGLPPGKRGCSPWVVAVGGSGCRPLGA
jgi:hypothetical protein